MTAATTLDLTPLTGTIGSEVGGIDLHAPLGDDEGVTQGRCLHELSEPQSPGPS